MHAKRIPGDSHVCCPHACIREIVAEERILIPTHCTIRNLLMDDRVMVRLPHTNIWVAGVVVSVLQYFNAISSDGYRIEYSSRGGWHVELFPASPDHILPAAHGPPPAPEDHRGAGPTRRYAQ
ncbi:hypothetical protein EV715DRAFT_285429 [Schizophyllum commune]